MNLLMTTYDTKPSGGWKSRAIDCACGSAKEVMNEENLYILIFFGGVYQSRQMKIEAKSARSINWLKSVASFQVALSTAFAGWGSRHIQSRNGLLRRHA